MQEKSGFHQRKFGISYHDRNKCRRFFDLCPNGSLAWSHLGDVVSVGSSNVKAIDDESFVLFSPLLGKFSLPPPSLPSPTKCLPSKQL